MINTELMPVPFKGATLYLADDHQEPYVPMRPVVEGMGLAWKPQYIKLTTQGGRWESCITMMVTQLPGGTQNREVVCMPLKKLPGWLMSIDPNKVKPEIRQTIIDYQNECDDVLWEYWSNRGVGKTFKPETGFSASTFEGHEQGSLNPYVREFRAMMRFNMSLGHDRPSAVRKANDFVQSVYGLDMCELNNLPAEVICPDEHLELEQQRIIAGKQPPQIDAFWTTYYSLSGQQPYGLNHSSAPGLIAINLKEFEAACNHHGLPVPVAISRKNMLQMSKSPAFVQSNRSVRSTIDQKVKRCWIFATN